MRPLRFKPPSSPLERLPGRSPRLVTVPADPEDRGVAGYLGEERELEDGRRPEKRRGLPVLGEMLPLIDSFGKLSTRGVSLLLLRLPRLPRLSPLLSTICPLTGRGPPSRPLIGRASPPLPLIGRASPSRRLPGRKSPSLPFATLLIGPDAPPSRSSEAGLVPPSVGGTTVVTPRVGDVGEVLDSLKADLERSSCSSSSSCSSWKSFHLVHSRFVHECVCSVVGERRQLEAAELRQTK